MAKTPTTKKKLPPRKDDNGPRKLSPKTHRRWEEIVTLIKTWLHQNDRKQGELAALAGLNRPFLNRVLRNPTNFTLETIAQLEKALKIDLIQIAGAAQAPFERKEQPEEIEFKMSSMSGKTESLRGISQFLVPQSNPKSQEPER